ncbi:MAG TPA: NAD-dependent dehydratase [Deltaproteobacteria bacterium]|nr:NAD-dependent dehydratase [Deltaproteobacteria bacterium]
MGKILITGAGGFIGSHLAERCVELGYSVRAYVHYNSKNGWGWLDSSSSKSDMEIVAGDIRDYDSVLKAINGCDTVFHLAALIGIPYSYTSPLAYLRINIEGTYNILESSKNFHLESVLITSTSETYGSAQTVPINESHPSVGQSPYSASKIAADQLAISYHRSFGLPVKIVRPFNTFGPRQSARAVIPTIITQLLDGRQELQLGNTDPTRDLTFVRDTVEGFIEISKCPSLFGEATNIGMNEETSIGDLAHLIAELMGLPCKITTDGERIRPVRSEVDRLRADNSKLMEKTPWRPRYGLQAGLLETISWFREHGRDYKTNIYNV